MVVTLVQKNKLFKIIFDNDLEVVYRVHDSDLADAWIHKIKHLQNIPADPVESHTTDVSNIKELYREFCKFADIDPIDIVSLDQITLNHLHKIYEEQHEKLSRIKNNSILYKFHHSIHFHEKDHDPNKTGLKNRIMVGWGKYEGILTKKFNCNNFYEQNIKENNIYLPWTELGKTPRTYWKNKEPSEQDRFNTLAKPHTTFRAKFFIATSSIEPTPFEMEFVEWFNRFKRGWLAYHNISKWDSIDEDSAPLLATTSYNGDLKGRSVKKIIIL